MKDTFSGYHPLISFIYFGLVLLFSMFFLHPVCLVISLLCALAYSMYLKGRKAAGFGLKFMLPVLIIAAVMSPIFNHQGATIIAYLQDGNPLTLESILYGIAAAVMMITVICWFSCFNAVITTDKFVYLFGRIIPSMSLILSMTFRFVPMFIFQMKNVSMAQRCIGRDTASGGLITRCKNGIKIVSVMVTWSLENAIETADSMKSRGYGLPGRTAFSIFRFDYRDRQMLVYLICIGIYITTGSFFDGLEFNYYPVIQGDLFGLYTISLYLCYFALCITPVVVNIKEDIKWRALKSAI